MKTRFQTLFSAFLTATVLFATRGPVNGQTTSITVTNGTLAAVQNAINNPSWTPWTVYLAFTNTITTTTPFYINYDTVVIATGGSGSVVLSGGGTTEIFNVGEGINFTMGNLTLTSGKSQGGAGSTGSTGSSGTIGGTGGTGANGGDGTGGALYNGGNTLITNCIFLTNTAAGGTGGTGGKGGNGTSIAGNGGTGGNGGFGFGGAIYNDTNSVLIVSNCTFTGNTVAGAAAGAGGTNGTGGFAYPGNGGVGGPSRGGAIFNAGIATIWDCTFNANLSGGGNSQAAGIPLANGSGGTGANGPIGAGGALYNINSNSIINSTFYGNHATGGNGGKGGNSTTVYGGNGGNGGNGDGGSICNAGGSLHITNCTFSAGGAYGGAYGVAGSGPFAGNNGSAGSALGGNLANTSGTTYFKNSILNSPASGVNCYNSGTFTDQGNNISSDATPTFGSGSHNSLNPSLGSLTVNGGPTLTMGLLNGSPAIGTGDTTAAPIFDQRGYWRSGVASVGAYQYAGVAAPIIQMFPLGPNVSEDGDVGLFYLQALWGTPVPSALTVNYTISGTAVNGTHYVTIPASVTIPAGGLFAQTLIRAYANSFTGTPLTVVLTLTNNPLYLIDANFASGTAIIYPHSTFDPTERYVRGTSTAPDYQSFVVPLDSQVGVPLDASGGNASTLFPGNPWTTNFYHYNATNLTWQTTTSGRLAFQNPIVAFGSPVGGSPLYLNQNYNFGIAAGEELYSPYLTTALRIQVYYRSNSALAGSISLPLTNTTFSSQLTGLATNGFVETFGGFGLQTTVTMTSDYENWGLYFGQYYILTHTTSAAATNYYYVVEQLGLGPTEWLVMNAANNPDWSKLYAMEFSPVPAGRPTFVDQPQFNSVPLPPAYAGTTVQELTNIAPTLPSMASLTPASFLSLDNSPELRRHPTLDSFVTAMNNDPLALANYVINEIDLTDAVDYDTNYNSQPSVNLGGLDRGALATFREGQGSPAEQCALLIYLLRQAGVPAAYVYPPSGGLQMLDFQASKLLRMQLRGALSQNGQTNLPQLISVNYPWVTAYVSNNWVQIFPWLKDTEITEGLDLYKYMPTNYNSGYKWLRAYMASDSSIFSLSSSDQPMDLLPPFVQNYLNTSYPGVSVDDLGVQIVNRRHLYSRWTDFPLPFSLSGTPTVLTNLSGLPNNFNTLQIQVYSQANPANIIDTTPMRVLDFHDRMLLLKFQQISNYNSHNMILSLATYSTNVTSATNFGLNSDSTWYLANTNVLTNTDDNIVFKVTHQRNKFLPGGYTPSPSYSISNLWQYNYNETGQQGASQVYVTTSTFRKGDLVAFAVDVGRVTQDMLDVQAQAIWQYNQHVNPTNSATWNPDIYQGTVAYLLGMTFFNTYDAAGALIDRLHKIQSSLSFQYGFGLIRPERISTGALTNGGNVIPILPAVHMPDNGFGFAFNTTLRPDSGRDSFSAQFDWLLQRGLAGSAAEHGVLRSYYQTNAISAVKLLQQAGTNVVALNVLNYQSAATNLYGGIQLQNADATVWNVVTNFLSNPYDYVREVFITPGNITSGTFSGVGALLFGSSEFSSPVSGLNGGFATSTFLPTTFAGANSGNVTVYGAPPDSDSSYILQTAVPTITSDFMVDGASTSQSLPSTYSELLNNQVQPSPELGQLAAQENQILGTASTAAGVYGNNYGGAGTVGIPLAENDASQRASDPVNVMTGEFYIDTVDLSLPGPFNLQVRRNYGSQNLAENQFGFGWRINYMPFLSLSTGSTLIYAAEMDGTVVGYRQTSTNANVWLPQPQDNPTLNNNSSSGIGSIANLFNNRIQLSTATATNVYTLTGADGSQRIFTQNSFPIGSLTRQRPYLNTWTDNRGNSYIFAYGNDSTLPDYGQLNRIQAANGNFVAFNYDIYGHIIRAFSGDGRIFQYAYDQYGDLATVTFPDESQINYVYQHLNVVTNGFTIPYSTHLILQELKPDGRILQNAYDSQRRVTNQMATVGTGLTLVRNATFAYTNNFSLTSPTNQLTGGTGVFDYTNNLTVYYYTNSLIGRIMDPLGHTNAMTWYGAATNGGYPRSLKSRTDQRGLTTTYQYDAYGNATTVTQTGDLTGTGISTNATTTTTYNANNLPMQISDPIGNSVSYVYDSTFQFLPQQIIKSSGATSFATNFFIYTNATTVVTDGSLQFTQRAFGLRFREIRAYSSPYAASNDWYYNGAGLVTETIQYTGTADPAIINYFFYNERNELVQRTDAAGRAYAFGYDALGRPEGDETFDVGQTTPMDWHYLYYNANGEVNWIDGPRYNPEDFVWRNYDGAGRKIQEIQWRSQGNFDGSGVSAVPGYDLYATTSYQYDPLGDLTRVTDPLGNYLVQSFDAIGELTKQVYYASNGTAMATVGFAYTPGGLVAFSTNALGGITTNLYTSTGKLKSRQNPDGSTVTWLYDLTGRTVCETVPNGNYWLTTYNDAAQTVTRVFNHSTATLATNVTQLDLRGNVVLSSDNDGNVSTNLFDGLDRIKVAAGPVTAGGYVLDAPPLPYLGVTPTSVQQINTYIYDNSGITLSISNALNETSVRTSDPLGRPINVSVYNAGGATPVRVTSTFYSPDHNSFTVTNGTGANAIVTTTYTDTANHPVLTIHYPTNGIIEYTWQQYDPDGNCIARQALSANGGTITTWTTNGWTYDGLNRVATEITGDGATTSYGRDAMGNVTSRAMPGGLTWSATYLNDGRIATEVETGGSLTARSKSYTYYASGTPNVGLLSTITDGRSTTWTKTYDDFSRLSTSVTTGSLAEQKTTTTYQYDPEGYPTNETFAFASNTTGPPTAVIRTVDGCGRTFETWTVINGEYGSYFVQTWDPAGRRTILNLNLGMNIHFAYQGDGMMTFAGESSFGYANNGLLTGRTNGSRTYFVGQRDGRGRILAATNVVGISTKLAETFSWRNDGKLSAYTATRADFNDARNYSYSTLARRLTQESFAVTNSQNITNIYAIDQGVPAGLGILTSQTQSGIASGTWATVASVGVDGLSRVAAAQDNVITRSAYGTAVGAGSVSATLDGHPLSVQFDGPDGGAQWRADMELAPGPHTLTVAAADPGGIYHGLTNSTFASATNSGDRIQNTYDGNGNVTQRLWTNGLGQTTRTQTLTWDAFDRLIGVTDRDTAGSGYNWTAIYDPLGRRLRTINTQVITNTLVTTLNSSNAVNMVDSWYDPEVEFLELATVLNGNTFGIEVSAFGPDASGVYGGMNGVGGLENTLRYGYFDSTGFIQDYFGNVLATIDGATVSWNPARFTSYGPVPGYQSPPLSSYVDLPESLGWRGRRVDETGLIDLGARLYDPVAGRFLSADPMGHDASMDLYSFCGGDPVNSFDPSGRVSAQFYQEQQAGHGDYEPLAYSFMGAELQFNEDGSYRFYNPGTGMNFYSDDPLRSPLAGALDDIHPIDFAADTLLNANQIKESYLAVRDANLSQPYGASIMVVGVVGLTASLLDAAGNIITLGGKAALEKEIKAELKGLVEAGAKESAWWEKTAWTPTEFNGRRVYQRTDLFDPLARDANGLSNAERMAKGRAPIGFDGESVNLHHTIQAEPGPIAEVGGAFHSENTATLHGMVESGQSFRYSADGATTEAENAFRRWSYGYWQARAKGLQ